MLFLLKRIFWHLIGIAVVKECCIGPVFTPFDPPTCVNYSKKEMGVIVDKVQFKSKLTVRCESQFSTRFSIPTRIKKSRTGFRESSLARQKTEDSPMTDFSIILH